MSRIINEVRPRSNEVAICGKVLDVTYREGKTKKDQRDYRSAEVTLRVDQEYLGISETSEIRIKFFATEYTKAGTPSKTWDSVGKLRDIKTVQNVGVDAADVLKISRAELRENPYVARSGKLINAFEPSTNFYTIGGANDKQIAVFFEDIYVMRMDDELDTEGIPTGRLKIQGAVLGYGEQIYVFDFFVEDATVIAAIRDNWEPNNTVKVTGRIRITSTEVEGSSFADETEFFGEVVDVPSSSTRTVHELIITGAGKPMDEENAYAPEDIQKMWRKRQAYLDQLLADAQTKETTAAPMPGNSTSVKPATQTFEWQ